MIGEEEKSFSDVWIPEMHSPLFLEDCINGVPKNLNDLLDTGASISVKEKEISTKAQDLINTFLANLWTFDLKTQNQILMHIKGRVMSIRELQIEKLKKEIEHILSSYNDIK